MLYVATSTYNDAFAQEWHPNHRYTVSFLRDHGIDVEFVYVPIVETPSDLERELGAEAKPSAVFFVLTEENYGPLLRFLAPLRRAWPETRIMVGGLPATLTSESLLQRHKAIDLIVTGEWDLTLLETIETLRAGKSLHNVKGLQSRDLKNPPRPLMPDLDALGNMALDGLATMLAGRDPEERVGYVVSSRGCYANCSFCGVPAFYRWSCGTPWRGRSAQAVVSELRELAITFQLRRFVFQDDSFFGPGRAGQERARQIADEILNRGLDIQYALCCRLNDIQEDTFKRMIRSGLSGIGLSVESTSQESLDLLNKGIRSEAIYPTLALIEALHLPCEVNLIFFDPYLTLQGVRKNLALIEYLRDSACLSYSDAFPFNELKPFPWSPISARLRAEGLLDQETNTCRFRDPAVAQLAAFVRRLRQRIPLRFKKRVLFRALESAGQPKMDRNRVDALAHLSAGLRRWVGLTLLPRFVAAACDVLDDGQSDAGRGLKELEERFMNEAKILWILDHEAREATLVCGESVRVSSI